MSSNVIDSSILAPKSSREQTFLSEINLKPLITETYPFAKSIEAYDYAVSPKPTSLKVQIEIAP